MMYQIADRFFVIFHTILIIFNLFGWIWSKTRKLNLITLSLTAFSWFVIGIFCGIGYCPLTDWHWNVLHKLGVSNLPDSYIKYLADRLFRTDLNLNSVNLLVMIVFIAACILSVYFNFFRTKQTQT